MIQSNINLPQEIQLTGDPIVSRSLMQAMITGDDGKDTLLTYGFIVNHLRIQQEFPFIWLIPGNITRNLFKWKLDNCIN